MRKGFTLIELMIVIAIIAIIAAIAIPNLLESRITANESQAGSNLKSGLLPAQVQFQSGGYVDEDADGIGIYSPETQWMAATWAAGGGAAGVGDLATGPRPTLNLALLDAKWVVNDATPIGAYGYQVDVEMTAFAGGNEENNRERYWAGYAAPAVYNDGGRRFFAINSGGSIYANLQSVDFSADTLATISDTTNANCAWGANDPTTSNAPAGGNWVPYQK